MVANDYGHFRWGPMAGLPPPPWIRQLTESLRATEQTLCKASVMLGCWFVLLARQGITKHIFHCCRDLRRINNEINNDRVARCEITRSCTSFMIA